MGVGHMLWPGESAAGPLAAPDAAAKRFAQATTSGSTSSGARFRHPVEGVAGELQQRCATRSRFR